MTMLESPESMLSETASSAVARAFDCHQRLRHCADGSAEAASVYLATWSAFHEAGVSAICGFYDAWLRTSQAAIEVALHATPHTSAKRPRRLWPEASIKLSASGTKLLPAAPQHSSLGEADGLADWFDSMLRFPDRPGDLSTEPD